MRTRRNLSIVICLCINLVFPYTIFALPQKGSVVSGQVDMSASARQMNIHQHSQKAIIDWQSFNIDSGEMVRFVQPNVNAAMLNRVTGFQPSLINGMMQANGNVFLINPNGILVGQSGVIQAHGFIGATLSIDNTDFLNNSFTFRFQPGTSLGKIINRGLIESNDAGFVSLLAPQIENHGTIMANMGKIHLAAGERIKLSFVENDLISFAIAPEDMPSSTNTHIENTGMIQSDAGEILISAKTAGDMVHSVVNNSGVIEATSLVNDNGVVRLTGADEIHNTGIIDVSGVKGGQIDVSANTIVITEHSELNASGDTQGGQIHIGGGLHGQDDTLPNAQNTYVGNNSLIQANANESGDGGEIILWSDQTTIFTGNISANGGALNGQGGFVEVSGKEKLFFDGNVSTKATNGPKGTLLLDPKNIYIVDGNTDDLGMDFSGHVNFSDIPEDLTIAEERLESLNANTDIRLQANNRITIMDLTDDELTLFQTGNVSFLTGAGGFTMEPTDKINVSGGGNLFIDAFGSENDAFPATDGPVSLGTIWTVGSGSVTIQGAKINLLGPIYAGGTVTIRNRDVLSIDRDIITDSKFLQEGHREINLGGNITATDELSFTLDSNDIPEQTNSISLIKKDIHLTSKDGGIYLVNIKIVEGITENCELTIEANSVASLNDININALTFSDMKGGLVLNGVIDIEEKFDTTPVKGPIQIEKISEIRTNTKPVIFNTPLTLKDNLTIHTGDQGGDISFLDTIDGPFTLNLTSGTGNILFQKSVGSKNMINGISIISAQHVKINDDFFSDSLVDLDFSGLLSQGGAIRTTGDNILIHGNVRLTDNSAYDTGLDSGGDLHIMGNIDGTQSLEEDLDIITGKGDITINGAVGSTSNTILGDIQISGAHNLIVDGPFQANSLMHPSGTGNVHFKDTLTTYEGGVHLHGLYMELNKTINSNKRPVLLAANGFKFDGEINAQDSSVTLYAHSPETTIGLGDMSCDINFSNNDLHNLKTNQIIIGHIDNTGGINIARDETISQNKKLQFVSSGPISIRGNIVTGNNAQVIVTNYDTLSVAPGANLALDGGWLQNGDGQVEIGGKITTTNDIIQFDGPVRLAGNLSLETGSGEGDIHFASRVDGYYYLSANSGMGKIIFADQVGVEIAINSLTLDSSNDIEIGSLFHAGSMKINNNGVLRLTAGADIQLKNAFSQQGIGPVELAGKITTENENITFTQPVSLIANAELNTGSGPGNIVFQDTLDGNHLLTMSAGDGDIVCWEDVGNISPLAGLRIKSAQKISFLKSIVAGEEHIDITAKTIELTAPVTTKDGGLLAFDNSDLLKITEDALLTLEGSFIQRSAGPVQLSTDIVASGDIDIKGPLTITKDIRLDTGSGSEGNIHLSNTVTGNHFISLRSNGNILFDQALSVNGLKIESAERLTINGTVQLDAAGFDAVANNVEINNDITTHNNSSVKFVTDGDFKLTSGAIVNTDGSFTQEGAANINLNGSIQTNNHTISFDGNVTLSGQSILTSGDDVGDIVFKGEIDGAKDAIYTLSMNAGLGNISLNGQLGRNDLLNLNILSAKNVSLEAPSRLNSYIQEAGTGMTHIKDTLYLGAGGFSFKGKDLSFEKNVSANDAISGIGMQINQSGQLNIKSATKITLTGSFLQAGEGAIALGGHIETTSANIETGSPIVLIGNAIIQSNDSGNITIKETVDGPFQLDLSAGTGDLVVASPIGNQNALLGLSVKSANNIQINVPVIAKNNGIQLNGNQIEAYGNWFTDNGQILINGDIVSQGNWQTAGGQISIHGNTQSTGNWFTTGGDITVNGSIQTAGDWKTDGGDITINGNTTLTDDIFWQTNNGNIVVDGIIDGSETFTQNMTINANEGSIAFHQSLGENAPLKNVDIQSATNVSMDANVHADRFILISANGQTQTRGAITTNTGGITIQNKILVLEGNLNSNGNDMILAADQMTLPSVIKASNASVSLMPLSKDASIGIENPDQTLVFTDAALDGINTAHLIFGYPAFDGSIFVGKNSGSVLGQQKDLSFITNGNISIVGSVSTEYQNNLTLDHGQLLNVNANFMLNGDFVEKGNGTVEWAGNILSTGNITFNRRITLTGNCLWNTNGGNLTVFQTIDGPFDLQVETGDGSTEFAQALGKQSPLTSLHVIASQLNANEIHTSMQGITIDSDIIQLNNDISTLQGHVLFDGDIHILSDLQIVTSGGNLTFNGQLTDADNTNKITIATSDGSISFQSVNMDAVVFNSGGNLILNDNVTVSQEWNTTQLADIQLHNDITIQTDNTDIQMTNNINGHHSLALDTGADNMGNVHISSDMGQTEALNALSIKNAAACYIDGNIITANGDVYFKPSVLLTNDLSIDTGTGVGDVRFLDKVFSTGEKSHNLNITSGGGDIYFMRDVGPNTPMGKISIAKARNVFVESSFNAKDILITPSQLVQLGGGMTANNGNITINGNLQSTQNQLQLKTIQGDITISGKVTDPDNTHTLTLNANTGKININDISLGALEITAADQGLILSGDIEVNDHFDTSNIAGAIMLKNHTTIRTRDAGNIKLIPSVDGPYELLLSTNNGTVFINKPIGQTQAVKSFIIDSAENVMLENNIYTSTGQINIQGNVSLLQDNIVLDSVVGNIILNGIVTDNDNDFQLNIDASAGDIYLWDIDLSAIQLQAPNKGLFLNGDINLKNAFNTSEIVGPITIQSPLSIETQAHDVVLNTNVFLNGDLTIKTGSEGGNIVVNGEINGAHGLAVSSGKANVAFNKDIGNNESIANLSVISGKALAINGSIHSQGNVHLDNTGTIDLRGDIQTISEGADVVVSNADIQMTGNRSIATYNGNIVLDKLTPSVNDAQTLVLFAGNGNITIDQALGSPELAFQKIDIMGAKDIHLMGLETTVHAKSFQIASIGDVRLDGQITLSADLNLNVNTLQINANIASSGNIHIANNDLAQISANLKSSENVTFSGPGNIELDGDILAEKDIKIDQARLSLCNNHYIRSQSGGISLYNVSTKIHDANTLSLSAGTNIDFQGTVGESDQVLDGIQITNAQNVKFAKTDESLFANRLIIQSVANDTTLDRKVHISGDMDITTKSLTIHDTIEAEGNIKIKTTGKATMSSTMKTTGGKIDWNQADALIIDQNIDAKGGVTLSGSGDIHLNADISITGIGSLSIGIAKLTIKGDHQLKTNQGNILLNAIETDTPDTHELLLSSGNGNVEILGSIGSDTSRLGGFVITEANEVAFSGDNETINVNTLSIHNKDVLTIKSDIQTIGNLMFSGAGNILLGANLETSGADSNISILYSTVKLMSDCAIISHHGDIQLADVVSQIDDNAMLQLDANNNQIFLNGATGRTGQALSGLDIVRADHVHIKGDIHISGDININARLLLIDHPVETVDKGNITLAITEKAEIHNTVTSQGKFQFNPEGQLFLDSTIETTAPISNQEIPQADIDIQAPLVLSGNSYLTTQKGDITLSDISSESHVSILNVSSTQGNISFKGSVGNANDPLSEIRVASSGEINFESSAKAIYTDQLRIQNSSGNTNINAPLYVNDNVLFENNELAINADIHFQSNANLTIITSGPTYLNADLQVPGNILFDGIGEIRLAANLETTVPDAWIKAPDAALIVSGDRYLKTQAGDIELSQIKGGQITLSPDGGNVIVSGAVGKSDTPIGSLKIEHAENVSFISSVATIDTEQLDIAASGNATFEGDITVEKELNINVAAINITAQLNAYRDVTFDTQGDLTIMGLNTNNQGNVSLISQTGAIRLGEIDAGMTGSIELNAKKDINGGTLVAQRISVQAATIGTTEAPVVDTQYFTASLTGSGDAFVGNIKMAKPGASLPKNSQINYLGDGLMVFLIEDMSMYGLDGKDRVLYPLPALQYKQHKMIHDAYLANRPEFFMLPPLNVDISIEDDAEIEFLEMD
jgi:filamentous hemagglutinin family protein